MRKKRSALGAGLLFGLVFASTFAPANADIFQPGDKVSRAIRKAVRASGEPVGLIPKPFKSGMTKSHVEKILSDGKFKSEAPRVFSLRSPREFPPDSQFFSKKVSVFPCAYDYVVVVRYDEKQTLLEAVGTQNQLACT